MFIPNSNAVNEAAAIKAECSRVEQLCLELVPEDIRSACQISVTEVQCGDPNCAPIDTALTIIFDSGGRGMLGIPMSSKEVTEEDVADVFPPESILRQWFAGEQVDWLPDDDDNDDIAALPTLRFDVSQPVWCRIGPDPITGWAKGTVVQLWYREQTWPEGSWAPYKIQLEDGRYIFAPGDMDQIIKKRDEEEDNNNADA